MSVNHPYCVGIAASAGGLDALALLIRNLPVDAGAVYVVAQHMAPTDPGRLVSLIEADTSMVVQELTSRDVAVQPDTIYVPPPNRDVVMEKGLLGLRDPIGSATMPKPSADRLFTSLAKECGTRGVGIVLSGTGFDGSSGVQDIRAAGGITLAQNTASAKYADMPIAALATGCVDLELLPRQMGQHLTNILSARGDFEAVRALAEQPAEMSDLMQLLLDQTDVDFTDYKDNTVDRRVARRMIVLGIEEYDNYVAYCRETPDEVAALFRYLMISVTQFFRDPAEFAALDVQLRELVARKGSDPIRIWVAGCATGEEVYSIAILVAEALGGIDALDPTRVRIYATDIDARALDVGRAGLYPMGAAQSIPPPYLAMYFKNTPEGLQVDPALRAVTSFSAHNIFQDPAFSNIDVVSLRNVMIYFNAALQDRVMARMYGALNALGLMFLGTSEIIGKKQRQFSPVPGSTRIFTKRDVRPDADHDQKEANMGTHQTKDTSRSHAPLNDTFVQSFMDQGVLANGAQEIVQVWGDLAPFWDTLGAGRSDETPHNTKAFAEPLRADCRHLIPRCLETQQRCEGRWRAFRTKDASAVRLVVWPIGQDEKVLVAIETDKGLPKSLETLQTEAEELQLLNADLRTTIQELSQDSSGVAVPVQLETVVATLPYPILVLDADLNVQRVSHEGAAFFGIPRQVPKGCTIADLFPPAGFPKLADTMADVVLAGTTAVIPFVQSSRAREVQVVPLFDVQSNFMGLTISVHDMDLGVINKMAELMDQLGGISHWRLNLVTDVLVWSDEVFRIHGIDPKDGVPSLDDAINYYHPEDRALVSMSLDRCMETKSEFAFDARLVQANGTVIKVRSVGAAVLDKGRRVIALVGAFKRLD